MSMVALGMSQIGQSVDDILRQRTLQNYYDPYANEYRQSPAPRAAAFEPPHTEGREDPTLLLLDPL